MFSLNRVLLILGLACLGAFAAFAYGHWGPAYATEPLQAPFSLSEGSEQQYSFRVGSTATYHVEVHLRETLPKSTMEHILGNFVAGGGGAMDVAWNITSDGSSVAEGSNRQFGYSPIWGDGFSGVTIGTVEAETGREYVLALTSRNGAPSWDRCEPVVEVGLHPSQLEYLVGYVLLGTSILLVIGPVFLGLLAVKVYRLMRRRGSPDAEARHLTRA